MIDMKNIMAPVGLILILAAVAAPFFLRDYAWAMDAYRYVYGAGAVILLVSRLMRGGRSSDMKQRRLERIEVWVAVIFCVATVFLFYPGAELRDWIAFTLAGAALQAFASLRVMGKR